MPTLATGASVSVNLANGDVCNVSINSGFANVTVTPVNGSVRTWSLGPLPVKQVFGPYTEGAVVLIANQTASLNYSVPDFDPANVAITGGTIGGVLVSVNTGTDAQTLANNYSAQVTAAGGSLSATELAAITVFITRAVAAGYWHKLVEVIPFMGGFAGCPVKLKYSLAPVCTLNNFVSGDYSAALGLTADGVNKWVNTRLKHNDFASSAVAGMGVYVTGGNPTAANGILIGTTFSQTPQTYIRWQGGSTNSVDMGIGAAAALTGTFVPFNSSLPQGLLHAERNSLNYIELYAGGSICNQSTAACTASPSSDYDLGIFAQSNSLALFIACSIGFAFVTDGTFTALQAFSISEHLNKLMYDLGRMGASSTRRARYIPVIGQSNARGAIATPVQSTTQPYSNLRPAIGLLGNNPGNRRPLNWRTSTPGLLLPLTEFANETIATMAMNTVSQQARTAGLGDAWDAVCFNWGVGGLPYSSLAKGTEPYNNSVAASRYIAQAMAARTSGAFDVPALFSMHGESDNASTTYAANVLTWQSDYTADFGPLSGRTKIPIFHTQCSAWTSSGSLNTATAAGADQLLIAHETDSTRAVLVAPKYFLTYGTLTDGLHITTASMAKIAEYYGKAFFKHVVQGVQFEPLRPGTISRINNVVTVPMLGCVGNLVLDNVTVTDPGTTFGFEWSDTGTSRTISSVAVSGSTVTITLSGTPSGTMALRYAWTGTVGNAGGPTTGPRGCLRDSDTFVGYQGATLPNWCVHFSKTVT